MLVDHTSYDKRFLNCGLQCATLYIGTLSNTASTNHNHFHKFEPHKWPNCASRTYMTSCFSSCSKTCLIYDYRENCYMNIHYTLNLCSPLKLMLNLLYNYCPLLLPSTTASSSLRTQGPVSTSMTSERLFLPLRKLPYIPESVRLKKIFARSRVLSPRSSGIS